MKFKVITTYETANGKVIALLEKLEESPERYVVAPGWNSLTETWGNGIYSRDLIEAMDDFVRIARQSRVDTETVLERIGDQIEALNVSLEEYSLDCLFDRTLGKVVDEMSQAVDRLTADLEKTKSCFQAVKAARS